MRIDFLFCSGIVFTVFPIPSEDYDEYLQRSYLWSKYSIDILIYL